MIQIQNSFQDTQAVLYIVPTPIGNLEDITYRALRTLTEVTAIAAEDTRNTKRLLHYFDISARLISYHEHNKHTREKELLDLLRNGESLALVSDAGMPAISDPGSELVQAAIRNDIPAVSLPGANAALCALVGSGLSADEFLFYGFLPRKKKERTEELNRLGTLRATLLFYESPYRLTDVLKDMQDHFGNRRLVVARELTKQFEEYARGSAEDVLTWARDHTIKGECCIVVEGSTSDATTDDLWWSSHSIVEHVSHYLENEGLSSKDAIKQVALERKLPKRTVYQAYHIDG